MPGTYIKGLTGSITLPGGVGGSLNSITINGGLELVDVSSFGDGTYRVRTTLLRDLSGTAAGFMTQEFNPGILTSSDVPASMTIVFKSGYTITASVLVGSITSEVRYDGVNVVSFAWANAGGSTPSGTWNGS